jgi:hypothetical protein
MKQSRLIWIFGVAAAMVLLLVPLPALAQSCALCYTQAASSGSRMIQALKSGILILIAPPTAMSIGLAFICYRKRNQTRRDPAADSEWTHADSKSLEWSNDDSRHSLKPHSLL